ncbi:hypothetical protein [Paenibacillus sp. N3.4]|nr:hypothetical protein [Paenibacillus sp. N3.4]
MTYGATFYPTPPGRRRRISGKTLAKLLEFTITVSEKNFHRKCVRLIFAE